MKYGTLSTIVLLIFVVSASSVEARLVSPTKTPRPKDAAEPASAGIEPTTRIKSNYKFHRQGHKLVTPTPTPTRTNTPPGSVILSRGLRSQGVSSADEVSAATSQAAALTSSATPSRQGGVMVIRRGGDTAQPRPKVSSGVNILGQSEEEAPDETGSDRMLGRPDTAADEPEDAPRRSSRQTSRTGSSLILGADDAEEEGAEPETPSGGAVILGGGTTRPADDVPPVEQYVAPDEETSGEWDDYDTDETYSDEGYADETYTDETYSDGEYDDDTGQTEVLGRDDYDTTGDNYDTGGYEDLSDYKQEEDTVLYRNDEDLNRADDTLMDPREYERVMDDHGETVIYEDGEDLMLDPDDTVDWEDDEQWLDESEYEETW